jgi:hypothetical protein
VRPAEKRKFLGFSATANQSTEDASSATGNFELIVGVILVAASGGALFTLRRRRRNLTDEDAGTMPPDDAAAYAYVSAVFMETKRLPVVSGSGGYVDDHDQERSAGPS